MRIVKALDGMPTLSERMYSLGLKLENTARSAGLQVKGFRVASNGPRLPV